MGFLNDHFPRVNEKVGAVRRTLRLYWANGSPRAWIRLLTYPVAALRAGRPPIFVDIAATHRCQCRCVHCSAAAHADGGQELTTAEIRALLDQAASMGVLQVTFTGGEPLLRADMLELIRYAVRLGLLVRLNSNGLLLTRRRIHELKRAGLVLCGVSLDHPRPGDHDRLRGMPGLYERAIRGMRLLHDAGILCQLQVYVSQGTAGNGIRQIIALGRQLRVYSIFVFFAIASGRWESAFDELLTPEQEADVRSLQDPGFVNVELATAHTPCCGFARKLLYVNASGNVTMCPFVPYTMGNIRKEGIGAIWRRHAAMADPAYGGRCPMNTSLDREVVKAHADSVAGRLGNR